MRNSHNPVSTCALFAGSTLAAAWSPLASAAFGNLNMTPGVTPISRAVYDLHMTVLWVCVVIGVVVFGVMFYSILKFRKSQGAVAAHFHENTTVEVIWTAIPFVILVAIAVPATRTLVAMENTGNADVSIVATGYQWKWHYNYLDEGISFFSTLDAASNKARQLQSGIDPRTVPEYLLNVDNPLVVPTKKKVRILTTANDVIHAWWVPALGTKRDAIPGYINESWFSIDEPGTYRGQCAELCGKDHGFMPIVVIAKNESDYAAWVQEKKSAASAAAAADDPNRAWTLDELKARGEQVYAKACASCHQQSGQGTPGNVPALAGSEVAAGALEDVLDLVMYGPAGAQEHAFKEKLSDVEIASVIAYTRNAFGNSAGDGPQPKDVAGLR